MKTNKYCRPELDSGSYLPAGQAADKAGKAGSIGKKMLIQVQHNIQKNKSSLLIVALFILFIVDPTFAQNSRVDWSGFSNGFNVSNSTNSIITNSAGQSFAGTSTNGSSKIISGFLAYSSTIVTDVSDEQEVIPTIYKLNQNYPNPFNPSTIISYEIPYEGFVMLKVYNILGEEVKTLVNDNKPAGNYNINFDASGLASGMYIYRLTAGDYLSTKKMLMIK